MIKQAKSVKKNTNTVVFIFEDTKKSDLVTQLDQAQVDIILDYKENEKLKDNTVTTVQLEPSAKSSRLIIVQLGKKEDYSIKRFRGLVAKANRIVIKEDWFNGCHWRILKTGNGMLLKLYKWFNMRCLTQSPIKNLNRTLHIHL